jgi:hypothetical protein
VSFALRGACVGRIFGSDFELSFFADFSPTHSPPPLSRPAGRKRGASFGRVFEGGTFNFGVFDRCKFNDWVFTLRAQSVCCQQNY